MLCQKKNLVHVKYLSFLKRPIGNFLFLCLSISLSLYHFKEKYLSLPQARNQDLITQLK